jgi:hypothetical protein
VLRKSLEQLEIEADVALQVVNIVEGAVGVELELLLLRRLRLLSGTDAVEELSNQAKRIDLIVVFAGGEAQQRRREGLDGRMAPPGAEQKNDTAQEGKMPSDQIP